MNFGQPYSFIDEENDKILNYETVYDKNDDIIIDQNYENNKFKEEGIESFTTGQNNPSNINKPGVNVQSPHKPPMRQQQIKPPKNQPSPPPPQFQPQHQPHGYPKNKPPRYRPPPQTNNTYVYDTVVYDKPNYPYYNPYFNQFVNPYYNPYLNQPPVEVVEVDKSNNNNDNKNDNKKNEINVTNFLLFLIVIIGLFFLMKKN